MESFSNFGSFWHQWALGSNHAVDGSAWHS